jgi:hypothetical protein
LESWARACSALGAAALLLAGVAGFVFTQPGRENNHRGSSLWHWAGVGGGMALLISVILRAAAPVANKGSGWSPFNNPGDRAAWVALTAVLLNLAFGFGTQRQAKMGAVALLASIPVAATAAISALAWPQNSAPAPVLLIWTLVTAGFAVWTAGRASGVLTGTTMGNAWPAAVTFTALTTNILIVGAVNWHLWGVATGATSPGHNMSSPLSVLAAAWLVSAAGLVLRRHVARTAGALNLVVAAISIAVAVSVQWALPFR